jgi:tetratricopeptide (TPR) repeat protein
MKNFLLVFTIILFTACNNNNESDVATNATSNDEKNMQALITQYPDSFALIQNLASFYLEKQQFDAALKTINNSLANDTLNPFLYDMKSVILSEKGDTTNAIASLEKAIDILPKPEFIISLGALYAQTHNSKALEIGDALLIGNKANAEKEAFFIKGLYYTLNKDYEKAIPFFDKSIATSYTFMDAYMEKGLALFNLQKINEATAVFEKAVTVQNGYSEGYYQLGRCYEKLNKPTDAIDAYYTAIQHDPNYVEAKDALNRLGVK